MRTPRIALAVAALLSLAACGSPAPVTVTGSVTDLYSCCTGTDLYAGVRTGTRVQVLAPDGKAIGTARLGKTPIRGISRGGVQQLPFRVAVPREKFYALRIMGYGVVTLYPGHAETWKPGQRIDVDLGPS